MICCGTRKPGFFSEESKNSFYELDEKQDNYKGKQIETVEELKSGTIYLEGNFNFLEEHFKKQLDKEHLRIAYFGD